MGGQATGRERSVGGDVGLKRGRRLAGDFDRWHGGEAGRGRGKSNAFKSHCSELPCRGGVEDRREGWQPGRRWKSNAFKSHCSELPLRAGRRRRGGRGATDCFQVFDGYGGGGVGPELLCLARGIRQARRSEGRAAAGFLKCRPAAASRTGFARRWATFSFSRARRGGARSPATEPRRNWSC